MNHLKKAALIYFFLAFSFFCNSVFAQVIVATRTEDTTEAGLKNIRTNKWKYHKGDNAAWAKPNFNDVSWDSVNTRLDFDNLPNDFFDNIAWFRLSVNIDTLIINRPVAF